jgi:4-amino-4-deoxy-L-arabinose transferase-like glycosyltransferase
VLVLGVSYVLTLLPGVGYAGDTAKLQFIGYVLGTPHVTGYPTYVVSNYLFTTLFPLGSLAYKANLLSALFAVLAALLLYAMLRLLDIRRMVALASVLAFGLTPTLWLHATVAEVYTLNVLFVALVSYCLLRWHIAGQELYFYLGCAAYALSFGNHLTMITLLPAVVWLVWATEPRVFLDVRKVATVLLFIVLGAAQYAYIFWRVADPTTQYLEMAPTTFATFVDDVTGGRWKNSMFAFSPREVLLDRVAFVLALLNREYPFVLAFAALGVLVLRRRPVQVFLLLALAGNVLFSMNYDIPDIAPYFLPTLLLLAVYLAVALDWTHAALSQQQIHASLATLLLLLPLAYWGMNAEPLRLEANTVGAEVVYDVLQTVESDAVIVSPHYPFEQYFWYYLIGEEEWQARRDVYLINEFAPEMIAAYLYEDEPVYMQTQRAYIPPGLDLYVIDQGQAEELRAAGFAVTQVGEYLYRVE